MSRNLDTVDSVIEEYESRRARGDAASIRDVLPERSAPMFLEVLQELVRVDLEHVSRLRPASIEDYRTEYPELFARPETLAPLAYEEYRVNLHAGRAMRPEDFAGRYGIDTSDWPRPDSATGGTSDGLADVPELSPGSVLLDFVIVRLLGLGTFSRVYLARQTSLADRLVVVKLSASTINESDRLARLQHTNIVPVFSVHTLSELSVLCMPWFGETTLKQVVEVASRTNGDTRSWQQRSSLSLQNQETLRVIRRLQSSVLQSDPWAAADCMTRTDRDKQPAKVERLEASASPIPRLLQEPLEAAVLGIGRQLTEGLSHAHERGVLHRDLKPANVLLTDDGLPMLLDFNLAHVVSGALHVDRLAGGTLPYMSPEQRAALDNWQEPDARSDLYSLGVMLFELLTGRLPRPSGQVASDAVAASPRAINRSISSGADSIVRKCLEPVADNRYQSATELLEDLNRQLDHRPLKFARNRSVLERGTKLLRRHPELASTSAILGGVLIVALIAGSLWLRHYRALGRSMAANSVLQFQRQLPSVYAKVFEAAIGDAPDAEAQRAVDAALEPFRSSEADAAASYEASELLPSTIRQELERELAELTQLRQLPVQTGDGNARDQEASREPAGVAADSDDYLTAVQHVRLHEFQKAAALLAQQKEAGPQRFPVQLLSGMLERAHGDPARAAESLTAAIALQPNSGDAWYQRGVLRLQVRDYDGAIRDFSKTLEIRPALVAARVSRAIAAHQSGRSSAALEDLTVAIDAGFPETRIHFIRAEVYDALDRKEEAARDRRTGMSLTPQDDRSWVARALQKLPADAEGAVADLHRALECNPVSHDAFRNLSMVLSEYLRRPDESIRVLTEAIRVHPDDAYLWSGRGVLHARAGRRDEARADADAAIGRSREPLLVYMVACIHALNARTHRDDATPALKSLIQSLFEDPGLLSLCESDPDLSAVANLDAFHELVRAVRLRQASTAPVNAVRPSRQEL